jgi:hypothetical protein
VYRDEADAPVLQVVTKEVRNCLGKIAIVLTSYWQPEKIAGVSGCLSCVYNSFLPGTYYLWKAVG